MMRAQVRSTCILIGLAASAAATAGACSPSVLDGYAAGGTTAASTSTGPGNTSSTGPNTTSAAGGASASAAGGGTSSTSSVGGMNAGPTTNTSTGAGGHAPMTSTGVASSSSSSGATCAIPCAQGYSCNNGVCGNAVVDVSSFLATCAVLDAGEVWCWGRNVWGELGFAPTAQDAICIQQDHCQQTPKQVMGLPDPSVEPAVSVSAGREATCALTSLGNVYCWGSNLSGLLGHSPTTDPTCTKQGSGTPSTGPCSATPQKVALPAGVVATQISMGTVAACVLTSTNDVYCWGSNTSGELKSPISTTIKGLPVQNANVSGNAAQVVVSSDTAAQANAVCIRTTGSGDVSCWGASAGGTLFPATANASCAGGDADCSPTQVAVPAVFTQPNSPTVTASSIAAGFITAAALNGTSVTVWGSDNYGQSGLGAASPGSKHFDPLTLSVEASISAISDTFLVTVLLDTTGAVWALGWNDEGSVGTGAYGPDMCPSKNGQTCENTAVKIGLTGIAKVRSGSNNSAAIDTSGVLWMWGSNYMASLGHVPGTDGDIFCNGSTMAYCNPTPGKVAVP